MVTQTWPEIGGKQLRYNDATWELTGTVDVLKTGELLEVEARRVDDVRHESATLRFGLSEQQQSLNPGDLGDHFDKLDQEGDQYFLVVKHEPRTYRYELQGMEYR